ncbi:TrkH family potassium uptake protein [Macrococcus caseolyticus]|uniref:TrkH family potassium uptake protein n=2 Tax=Macrococcoides caseolyticum TaxID=69966 RepID=UPI0024BCBBBA|nr:TrkH family potassium uptake protein [Macrococcus caseolyticus]MDJ1090171.1 TrkH family potassium uptake protein [Macrococcus caseolyticus]MDJ1152909.1 TrkH family potassium uptake protein [Macrococcus caseolyticus]MDJ1155686.1 TrkH family potassium uptake protein [Macrococcus caseolyticus]MEB8170529.1 TrkH family potassium uptake protein [Macrococcus caseolyticus]
MMMTKLLMRLTPQQGIVLYYLVAIFISFLLLRIPYVHKEGITISYIDSLFVAVSGISVTGLSPVSIVDTYSIFGQMMIIFILNLGGIGVMAMGTLLWVILGKKIGMRERQLIMVDHNQNKMSGVVTLILEIVKTMLVIELCGALMLAFYFYKDMDSISTALFHGVFAAVSATTNGGLDITGDSLNSYADDYFVQMITMFLIVLGAIGFPVIIEVKSYLTNKIPNFRFSLFAKLTIVTYMLLFILGTLTIYVFEYHHAFKSISWHKALFYSMFQSATTRSAGLTTIDLTQLTDATQFFMSGLMFIGSSPSSVGGGIRTTTFAILILFLINYSNGRNSIKVFNKEIDPIDINRAFAVMVLATLICFIGLLLILSFENGKYGLLEIFFEVMSAFGTCGLSLGITADLSNLSKVVIMILMFIGRVGLISFIIMLGGKAEPEKFRYPKERIMIG